MCIGVYTEGLTQKVRIYLYEQLLIRIAIYLRLLVQTQTNFKESVCQHHFYHKRRTLERWDLVSNKAMGIFGRPYTKRPASYKKKLPKFNLQGNGMVGDIY